MNLTPVIALIEGPYRQRYFRPVARVTKKYFMVVVNDFSVRRYRRSDGFSTGDGNYYSSQILNYQKLNSLSDGVGGTWDSGWKPNR